MSYDILIKNGTIIDGSGSARVSADIGIKDGRIAHIAPMPHASAPTVIDAANKFVTPGFVDITNHSDTHLTLFRHPCVESMVMQGVTTIIGGNCGGSLAPLSSKAAIGNIRKWADPSQININWTTFKEYMAEIEKLRPGVNFGSFAGYGTLRRGLIGDEVRALTSQETEQMKFLLSEAMAEGALGLSLGLSYGHERVSPPEEIIECVKPLQDAHGVLKIHLRSEGAGLLASINEAIRIARETGVSIQISHFKAIGRKSWPLVPKAFELIENANASGLRIRFDVSPYRTTGSALYLLIPPGARQGGFRELFSRIDNPEERKKLIEAMKTSTLHYEKILVTSAKIKNIVGKTLAQIAERAGLSPEEALIETIRANEGRVTIVGKTLSFQNTAVAIENARALIASDGIGTSQEAGKEGDLIHPRSFGAFPRFWSKFVNEKTGITPEEAVRKAASGPALAMGISERGMLKKGYWADVAIFDPVLFKDRATYKNPFRYPAGIEWVIVNGKAAVENGRLVGAREGKAIRRT